MHAWEAIQESINYIEDHLKENISIEYIAEVAGLSPFYFQRLFARLVTKPVGEYMKLRRLALAANELKQGHDRIVDIAFEFGFSSHANFTRVFKDTYGLTPEDYRTSDVQLNHFVKPDLILKYVMTDENVPVVAEGMVLEVTRKKLNVSRNFIGIARELPLSELMGGTSTGISLSTKLWNEFHNVKDNIPNLISEGIEFGALYMGDAKEGFCTYMAGAEAISGGSCDNFTNFELPVGEYIICGFEAGNFEELTNHAVYKAQMFMERWMFEHQLTTTNFACEMYYPIEKDRAYMEQWMIAVPIEA